jgi:hypothetical protein
VRPWSAVIAAIRGGLSAQAASKGAASHPHRDGGVTDAGGADPAVLRCSRRRRWIQWEPVNRDNARAGRAHGFRPVSSSRSTTLTKADVILSLDADFLSSEGAADLLLHASVRRDAALKKAPTTSTASTSSNRITRSPAAAPIIACR